MNIFITGAAGYIGTGLVNQLISMPGIKRIVIYDNLSRDNYSFFLGGIFKEAQKFSFVEGDILDSRKLRKHLKGMDTVIHLAARVTTPFANIDSHFFEQVNHWGTAELVYALEESEVSRFVYLSSTSVYGRSKDLATEEKVPNPRTFYGISKLRGEEHVMRLFDKMQTYIIRCGNVYGYNKSMRFDSVINRFVFDANYKGRITINGNGTQARAFIHVEAISKILTNLISADVAPGIYNVATHNYQILELVDVLKKIYPPLEFIFVNQHLNLRGIRIQPNQNFMSGLGVNQPGDIEQEIRAFAKQLPFGSLSSI
jgi:UDP-glucose 4-epimerase